MKGKGRKKGRGRRKREMGKRAKGASREGVGMPSL